MSVADTFLFIDAFNQNEKVKEDRVLMLARYMRVNTLMFLQTQGYDGKKPTELYAIHGDLEEKNELSETREEWEKRVTSKEYNDWLEQQFKFD